MTGRILPAGEVRDSEPWTSGSKTAAATLLLAPNPSAWTLDGTNTWLLSSPGSGQTIVVDPGPADLAHLELIVAHALAVDSPVTAIVLTHGHADHSAGARQLAGMTGADVRAVDPEHRLGSEGLVGGEVLTAGSLEVRVVATPGHTSDSVCLLVESEGSLLTGDTVLGRGTSVVAWPDGELGPYLESLRQLRELAGESGVLRILPGHGPLLLNPGQVLDGYLEHRRLRLDEVRRVVSRGITDPLAIVAEVYAATPRALWPAAEMSVQAQLAYLATEG